MSEKEKQLLESIRMKIEYGLKLAIEREWQDAKRNNRPMAISRNGKVVVVNAADIK